MKNGFSMCYILHQHFSFYFSLSKPLGLLSFNDFLTIKNMSSLYVCVCVCVFSFSKYIIMLYNENTKQFSDIVLKALKF